LASYLGGKLLTATLVVLGAMLLLFGMVALVPGDPAASLLGPQATPEFARAFIVEMGLDRPLHERLFVFLGQVLRGNLGTDVLSGRPVLGLVLGVLPQTMVLTFAAIGLAVLLGVPLGVYAATHRGSVADHVLAAVSVAFIAMPAFVVAILLLLIFALWLDWLPVLGSGPADTWGQAMQRLVLPTLALSAGWIGFIARLMRSAMLEAMAAPHIRTLRAYGIAQPLITCKYALKTACMPTLAILGLGIGRLLGGAVLVEIVFARPGLGRLIFDAITVRNFPVVQGAVLVVVVLFVVVNLLVDLLYAAIDPRIRQVPGTDGR
jgi:peptide/nickel transport system permease protein